MKWYSHPTYKAHQQNIKDYSKGVGKYYSWVVTIANSFNREYASIGVLDINDLISAGNYGLCASWNKINWDEIAEAPEPDAQLWSFLKKRIKWEIRREIDKYSTHIKVPRRKLEEMRKEMSFEDQIFVDLFPTFFDTHFAEYSEEMRPWDQEQLLDVLNDVISKYIPNHKHQDILKLRFGIDTVDDKPVAQKLIAEKYNTTTSYIQNTVHSCIKKLKNDDVEKIIENFYEN